MNKCNSCGKFMSHTGGGGGAVCAKCKCAYHKQCVALAKSAVPKNWLCTNCSKPTSTRQEDSAGTHGHDGETSPCTTPEQSEGSPSNHNNILDLTSKVELMFIEMKSLRKEIKDEISKYHHDIKELLQEVKSCKNSMEKVSTRVGELEGRILTLENTKYAQEDSQEMLKEMEKLKEELNEKEQDALLNDIEIIGIPEQKGENVHHIAQLIAKKIGETLDDQDIVTAYRVGRTQPASAAEGAPVDDRQRRARPMVVRCARRNVRDRMLRAARVRRSITTADMDIPGPSKPVYINERLTKYNRNILHRVKEEAKKANWKFVWINNGHILARKKETGAVSRVRKESDIIKLFLEANVSN